MNDALVRKKTDRFFPNPVTDHFSVRLFTCIQLYLEREIRFRDFGRYLKKDKCNPMEETVLELAKATELTTAELLACVEQGAKAKNPKEVRDLLYEYTDATYESLADEAQLLHIQYIPSLSHEFIVELSEKIFI